MSIKQRTAIEVSRLEKPGLHAVGGVAGLCLQVTKAGSRSWILRATVGAKRRDIGLGGYPGTTLAQAREAAREARAKIREGIDPVEERKQAHAALMAAQATRLTFDEAARQFLAKKLPEFKNAKHGAQWASTLNTYASPVIGSMPVADVEIAHILEILNPIWETKTETAKRLRGRIENVLSWATVAGYRTGDNPARWQGHLDTVLSKPTKIAKTKHHRALPWPDIAPFMHDLKQREGISARAMEFLILTACRSGEVRGATWQEIDVEARMWTIPADRMKTPREHRVPLSDAAIALLEKLPRMTNDATVFTAPRGGQLSDMALSAVVKRMGVDAVPHGFRSTFRDWCAESTNYPTAVAEMALAHAIGDKVEAAYRRGDLLEKRTRLMNEWAKYCSTVKQKGDVVAIRDKRA